MTDAARDEAKPSHETRFRFLKIFNDASLRAYAGSKARVGDRCLPFFQGDSLSDSIVRELSAERAMPIKEVVESFEFFAVARRYFRERTIVDLCCGHGLTGLLFAAFSKRAERVVLWDRRRPDCFEGVWRALLRAAPWIESKVEFIERPLEHARGTLPDDCAMLGLHACGRLTDDVLDLAMTARRPVAVMPCCRAHALSSAPAALRDALGGDLAYDIDRTYRLESAGFQVRWREIPSEITPMNRILLATPRAISTAGRASEASVA